MGAKPYLTHEEEKEPVQLLINWAMVKQGRNEVVNMVHPTVEKKGMKVQKMLDATCQTGLASCKN